MIPHLTRVDYPVQAYDQEVTRKYDYTGADQILKRNDAIQELENQKFGLNYDGDLKGAIEAGRRIRALRSSLAGIQPVRVEAESTKYSGKRDSGSVHGFQPTETQGGAMLDGSDLALPKTARGRKKPAPTDVMTDPRDPDTQIA